MWYLRLTDISVSLGVCGLGGGEAVVFRSIFLKPDPQYKKNFVVGLCMLISKLINGTVS
jgi:hypothetical protein